MSIGRADATACLSAARFTPPLTAEYYPHLDPASCRLAQRRRRLPQRGSTIQPRVRANGSATRRVAPFVCATLGIACEKTPVGRGPCEPEGFISKSDRVDAAMIALFAARRRPRPNTTRGAKARGMSSGCIVGVMMRKLLLIARAVVRNGGVYDPAMIRFARP